MQAEKAADTDRVGTIYRNRGAAVAPPSWDQARDIFDIRIAMERLDHIVLAEMTGSAVLERYVSETSLRCGLILALYSWPHSSECAVSEHREIIDALVTAMPRGPSQSWTGILRRWRVGLLAGYLNGDDKGKNGTRR
jgi:DNA-binding GntR family transcriptional regulator